MAQAVQLQVAQSATFLVLTAYICGGIEADHVANLVRKDKALLLPLVACFLFLFILFRLPFQQCRFVCFGKIYGAKTVLGFWIFKCLRFSRFLVRAFIHGQGSVFKINIFPFERYNLTAAQAHQQRSHQKRSYFRRFFCESLHKCRRFVLIICLHVRFFHFRISNRAAVKLIFFDESHANRLGHKGRKHRAVPLDRRSRKRLFVLLVCARSGRTQIIDKSLLVL